MKVISILFLTLVIAFPMALAAQENPATPPPQQQEEQKERKGEAERQAEPGAFTGTLHDADCKARDAAGTQECGITASTTSFGLKTADGKFYKFDAAGNSKAKAALEGQNKTGAVSVKVDGKISGDSISVEEITVQ